MRVTRGVAELGVDAVEHAVGHRVLEDLGLVVDLVPAVAEFLHQERLHQPVPADHCERGAPAGVGQGDRTVLLVVDQTLIGEFADRLRCGRRRYADAFGQQFRADLLARPFLGCPDHFQIILGNRREVAMVTVWTHSMEV